jgi:hypothetical protein
MADYNIANVAGALYNHQLDDSYGRVNFVCQQFGLSRSDFYRKKRDFFSIFTEPGRKPVSAFRRDNRALKSEIQQVKGENERLKKRLREERAIRETGIKKLRFLLIAAGLPSRMIAWVLRLSFGINANHTGIAKYAQGYAAKATLIMAQYFHSCARTVAIDEVFVEGKPVLVAVDPKSLLICNCAVEDRRTEAEWTAFLNEMENLDATVSDRGNAILAAVDKREEHVHQSDHFHCMFTANTELRKLEARCYRFIRAEQEAEAALEKRRKTGKNAGTAARLLRSANRKCTAELERFDHLEEAVKMAFGALKLSAGIHLNSTEDAVETLAFVRDWIKAVHPKWTKVTNALKDSALLTCHREFSKRIQTLDIQADASDFDYIIAVLTYYWEQQASRRWRGKQVFIPEDIMSSLERCCSNLPQVIADLFEILEDIPRASSAVECINSRIGFFRYSKKRFNDDFANFICVMHNLTPFLDGKRKGKSPAEIEGVALPTTDIFELFGVI